MRPKPVPSPAVPVSARGGQNWVGQDWAGQDWTGQTRSGQSRGGPVQDLSDGPGRLPTEAEAAAITAAVLDSPLIPRVPPDGLRVTGIRTSIGAPDWAFAVVSPSDTTDPSIAVLRWNTGCGWVLDQVGTARIGVAGALGRHEERSVGPAAGQMRGSAVRRGYESSITEPDLQEAGVRPGDAARSG